LELNLDEIEALPADRAGLHCIQFPIYPVSETAPAALGCASNPSILLIQSSGCLDDASTSAQ